MSDLVGNPEDRFSHVAAHIIQGKMVGCMVGWSRVGGGLVG